MKIPFSKVAMAGNELVYLNEVLMSGWLTSSSKVLKLEMLFSDFIGVRYACAVNSCTSALHLALEAIGLKSGDKVLVPSLTFTATAEVIRYFGADPIFLDVEYGTGLVTYKQLEESIIKYHDIKALMLVHYGGQSAYMTDTEGRGIIDLCKKNHIKVIEDAAHAFPTKFKNQYIGTFGEITCFSFYSNKTITTGEGGMLVTNDETVFKRVKKMRLHGIDREIWQRFTENNSNWEYDVIAPGYKYNMPDVNAAIGLAQLEKAEYFRSERQRCAEYYFRELANISQIELPICWGPLNEHSWHLFPIIILPGTSVSRNSFIQRMAECGIGTSVHYKPLHRMTYYRDKYNLSPNSFPNTERIWAGNVSLPIFPDLQLHELSYICMKIREIVQC